MNLTMHMDNAQLDFFVPSTISGVLNSKQLTTICKNICVTKHHFLGVDDDTSICLRGRLDRISVLHSIIQHMAQRPATIKESDIPGLFKTVFVGKVPSSCHPTPLIDLHKNIQAESKAKIVYGDESPDGLYREVKIFGFMCDVEKAATLIQQAINREMRTETANSEHDPQVCFY
jgi:hypothetical protein